MKISIVAGLMIGAAAAMAAPPNIVLIVADDLGYADAGFTMDYAMALRTSDYLGQPWDPTPLAEVNTPNMDRLADQGVVFTSGYVNGNVCSPTRAGMMLGRYQQRTGVYGAGTGGVGFAQYEAAKYSESGSHFSRINPILPEFLKQSSNLESNYVGGAFGKWHLGLDEIVDPEADGDVVSAGGAVLNTGYAYKAITGTDYEEPDLPDGPINNIQAGQTYDSSWKDGSPWHCLNRGFDECFYFMGRGAHDFWDPNGIYDSYDGNHPFRRTTGLDARRNPGGTSYTGGSDADYPPVNAWDASAEAYITHGERIPANYMTRRLTDAACSFIGEQAANTNRPFFCYVPYNAAHSPLQAPYHLNPTNNALDRLGENERRYYVLDEFGNPDYAVTDAVEQDWLNPKTPEPNWFPDPLYMYEKYKDNPDAFRYFSGGSGQRAVKDDADIRTRCITLAMIAWMDKGIGRIVEQLKDPNGDGDESDSIYDNTIILFISDNGGPTGMRAANAPLRGNKSTNYEGGIRTPFVFSWPALLKAQNGTHENDLGETVANSQQIDAPVIAMDFLPTLLEVAGLDVLQPADELNAETQDFYDYTPDGTSLLPLIRGEVPEVHEYLFWCDDDTPYYDGAVRKGKWKLRQFDDGSLALYDLENDIAELNDVSADHPEIMREYRQAYFEFMNSVAASFRRPVPNEFLYTQMSSPPVQPGTAAEEEFDYPVNSTITNGASNGGANWAGAWHKSSTTDNGKIIAGNLLFNDPSSNYVDGAAGNYYGAYRKQIEMSRPFSSSAVAGPVWFSCLIENMEYLATPTEDPTHHDQQRWEFHPDNIANTYLRVGEGDTEYSRFVANGTSQDLDLPVDLVPELTYLVVMRMETDVSGANDSIKAWILPEGTSISGYSEAALGTPNLDKSDADLWSGGLTSMGFVGDAYQNQTWAAAKIDSVRVSYSGTNDVQRIEALFSPSGGEAPPVNVDDAVTVRSYAFQGDDAGQITFSVEYEELAGWLTSDATSGAVFEKASNLVSNDWTAVVPDEILLLDWFGDQKSYKARFVPGAEPEVFYRLQK